MGERKGLRPYFGTHVTGDLYWSGARPDPGQVVDRLVDGISVTTFGLRRIGKSSLIAETRERLRKERRRKVLWVDLQKQSTIIGVLHQILEESKRQDGQAHNGLGAALERLINDPQRFPPQVKAAISAVFTKQLDAARLRDADAYADTLLQEAGRFFAALEPEERPVLMFDELPFLILNALDQAAPEGRRDVIAGLNRFLAGLRSWRSRETGIAMSFSGSFSMAWLRREHGIRSDHFNDCIPLHLEEQARDPAIAMVEALVSHSPLPDWQEDSAVALIDILPSFFPGVIQLAYDRLRHSSCTPAAIREIHRDAILRAVEDTYLKQFRSRFERYSKPERTAVRKLLVAMARPDAKPVDHEAALGVLAAPADEWSAEELLEMLDEDGFVLASRSGGVAFASGLARAWHLGLKR